MSELISLGKFVAAFNLAGKVSTSTAKHILITVTHISPPGTSIVDLDVENDAKNILGFDLPFNYELNETLDELYAAGVRQIKAYTLEDKARNITRLSITPVMESFDCEVYVAWMKDILVEYAYKLLPDFDSLMAQVHQRNLPDDVDGDRYEPAVNVAGFRYIARAFGFQWILASRMDLGGHYSGVVLRLAMVD